MTALATTLTDLSLPQDQQADLRHKLLMYACTIALTNALKK